jgi:hypothetical protein
MDGADAKDLGLKAEKRRHEERLREIEKVKQQREQREREKMEKEEEREIIAREEALIEAVELEKREEQFHLDQAKARAEIRLREGRGRPIDLLSRNLHADPRDEEDGPGPRFDHSVRPLEMFENLTLGEMEELRSDLDAYLDLDAEDPEKRRFWAALKTVADEETADARRREELERLRVRGVDDGHHRSYSGVQAYSNGDGGALHASVEADVRGMLEGKSSAELESLEGEIERAATAPGATETEYWTAVLRRVRVHKARTTVAEADARMRAAHERREVPPPPPQQRRRKSSGPSGAEEASDDEDLLGADFGRAMGDASGPGDERDPEGDRPREGEGEPTPDIRPGRSRSRSPGGYTPDGSPDRAWSPAPADSAFFPDAESLEAVDAAEDAARLARLRGLAREAKLGRFAGVAGGVDAARRGDRDAFEAFKDRDARNAEAATGAALAPPAGAEEEEEAAAAELARARATAERMMGDGGGAEVAFAGEAALESQVYWWHDKYRPRKPKYFNRVHTGYDWNKYNQTHYDHDNPPPKTVQGYKFNVFYPDLIDKTKAPSYTIMPDGSKHGETCILRIHAGPPYEDIAFKIVNKEWEYGNKKGFRCAFERGIFHLYINFKRARYRR